MSSASGKTSHTPGKGGKAESSRVPKSKRRKNPSPRAAKVSRAQARNAKRMMKPSKRSFVVEPLQVDTLRPLVDLAYWSTFLEVRRDCAAAFATLSMNPANLQVLSQAGVLGALLALVGTTGSRKPDQQVQRDAATALSYLVGLDEIKLRLLQAPDGLKSLFYMARSQYVTVKRAAVKTLCNLASLDEAKVAIVEYVSL